MGAVAAGAALGRPAWAAPATPITFIGWQYQPQIVDDNVDIFKKLYDENVTTSWCPASTTPVVETKLIGGQHVDMMYSEEDHIARWNAAGWVRDLEGLPGVDADQGRHVRGQRAATCRCPTASWAACPTTAASTPSSSTRSISTKSGEAAADGTGRSSSMQCRKLKKDGVAECPYISAWGQNWASLSWSLFSIWYSEGAKVFDDKSDLVFDDAVQGRAAECTGPSTRKAWLPPTS